MPESSFCQTFELPTVSPEDLLATGESFTIFERRHFLPPELKDVGREWAQVPEDIYRVSARNGKMTNDSLVSATLRTHDQGT